MRLTGSGLGCDNWPRCGQTPFPAADFHALVEFGNRIVALTGLLVSMAAWLASRRVDEPPQWVRHVALAAFLGAVAQIPLGGLTVILGLHPLAVMSHFLLALVVVGLSVVVTLEAWSHARGLGAPVGPHWLRVIAVVGVGMCAVMVVTGAVATASGPHPVRRLERRAPRARDPRHRLRARQGRGGIRDRLPVPLLAAAPLETSGAGRARARRRADGRPGHPDGVGEVQYRNALPWGLVLVHVTLAATIWALTVGVAYALWRPPALLTAPAAVRADSGRTRAGAAGAGPSLAARGHCPPGRS